MSRQTFLASILGLACAIGTLPAAQVVGAASPRTGCTNPGPPDSLRAEPLSPTVYVPDERDVVNIEIESLPPIGNWVHETALPGYRGSGYFRWDGPNHFHNPGVDVLTFRFEVRTAKEYLIRLRNQHNSPDSTAENDCWFRFNGGPWIKLVDSWGSAGVNIWSFNAFLETTAAFPRYFLNPGVHVVELAGRSNNFKIDSLHVVPINVWFANTTDPQSDVQRMRPVVGAPMAIEVGDPTDAAGLPPGQTMALVIGGPANSQFPCGERIGGIGELLVARTPSPIFFGALPWGGPDQPARFVGLVPNDSALVGLPFTVQALLEAPGRRVITDALDLLIGEI